MSATLLTGARGTVPVAVFTYALALSAAKVTGSDIGRINIGIEGVSAGAGSVLGGLGALLPIGYAFAAGMVAAVNPCGFALLPAYLALYLGGHELNTKPRAKTVRLVRAARVALAMSAGFTLLFAVAGLLLGTATSALVRLFPWLGLAVGVALVALGARLVGGQALYASLGERIADRLGRPARQTGARASAENRGCHSGPRRSLLEEVRPTATCADRLVGRTSRSYFVYGLAYGAASLSCTLPIFLAVVGTAFISGDYLAAATQLLLYALGMSIVVIGVTAAIAVFPGAVVMRARAAMRYVEPASAVLLLLAGAYIIYYWLTLGGLLAAVHLI